MPTYYNPPLYATQYIFYCALASQADAHTFQTNPTLASGDVKVSIDGGSFTNLTTLPTVTPAGSTSVKVTLSASEMTGSNIVVKFQDAAGAEWDDVIFSIQPAQYQWGHIHGGAGASSYVVTVDDGSNPLDGVEVWVTTDSGGSNVVASGTTDTDGEVTFMLDAGSYYLWKQFSHYNFTNPESITVT